MRAIDCHFHVGTQEMRDSLITYIEAMGKHYKMKMPVRTVEEVADHYRSIDVKGIPVATDAESYTGLPL